MIDARREDLRDRENRDAADQEGDIKNSPG